MLKVTCLLLYLSAVTFQSSDVKLRLAEAAFPFLFIYLFLFIFSLKPVALTKCTWNVLRFAFATLDVSKSRLPAWLEGSIQPKGFERSQRRGKLKEKRNAREKKNHLLRHNPVTSGLRRSVRAHRVLLWPMKWMQLQSFHIEQCCLSAHGVR